MSKQINDGGPAYPGREFDSREFSWGMSLRDYFAGQALAGMTANADYSELSMHIMAISAWAQADFMLAGRGKVE